MILPSLLQRRRGIPSIFAIIPTSGNNIPMLQRCLRALHRASAGTRLRIVLVACPGGEEARRAVRAAARRGETVLGEDGPFSFAHSNNLGLSLRRDGEAVLLLNDDCFFRARNDLLRLSLALRAGPFACVGPWIEHARCPEELPQETRTHGIARTSRPLVGACLLWDGAWLDRVGLFDPSFDGYGMEEADLLLRALHRGGRWAREDRVIVDHVHHATFGASVKSGALHERNLRRWIEKYPDTHSWGAGDPWTKNEIPLPAR